MLKTIVIFLIIIFACGTIFADGGMWPLYDLEKLPFDSMHQIGLELQPDEIYNPNETALADAIAQLSGGSATFVSNKGLLITNHHVVFGSLQRHSTLENNFINDGYYAPAQGKELPALGVSVYVTLAIDDVTDKILDGIDRNTSDSLRYALIENRSKELVSETEKNKDVYCEVSSFYGGRQYMLYTYFKIKDIRLVYVPSDYIGNYGGEIDNWMWPRHAGDFAFVRAYVAPDGSSAVYSEDNVPYKPKRFVPISKEGAREGDFTMLMGYPGKTSRYVSFSYLKYLNDYYYPFYLDFSQRRLELTEKLMDENSNYAVRLASRWSGFSNYYKKAQGIMKGFDKADVLLKKEQLENQLNDYIAKNNLNDQFGHVIPQLDSIYKEKTKSFQYDYLMGAIAYSSDYLSIANRIVKWAYEKEKKDELRKSGYQERDISSHIRRLKRYQPNLLPEYEKEILLFLFDEALKYSDKDHFIAIDYLFDRADSTLKKKIIDDLVSHTVLGDMDKRLELFNMPLKELKKQGDPFIELAIMMKKEIDAYDQKEEIYQGALSKLTPLLINAYCDFKPGKMHPDANSTKRFNFGQVSGYSPDDGVEYRYYTTLSGMMAKETGVDPFIVPNEIKEAYKNKKFGSYFDSTISDIPANILVNNNGTNGSSGSSVLNGKGELVGLDFDTNFDGVIADYWYDPTFCRAITVSSRYMLYLMDEVYQLDELLEELTIH